MKRLITAAERGAIVQKRTLGNSGLEASETIVEEITKSVACFAEISEDNPNVWFELGYAIARDKPLCIVCSDLRTSFPLRV